MTSGLLCIMQCSAKTSRHNKVELFVSRFGGIKTFFNYVYKGRDKVAIQLRHETARLDELGSFVKGRYINASEVAWRKLGFRYVDKQPFVARPEVHPKGYDTVYNQEKMSVVQPERKDAKPR